MKGYTTEESFVNGISNAILGAVEAFIVSILVRAFMPLYTVLGVEGLFSMITLIILIPAIWAFIRIFIAFSIMRQPSTILYYLTFVGTYAYLSIMFGDYLSAILAFIIPIFAIILRYTIDE